MDDSSLFCAMGGVHAAAPAPGGRRRRRRRRREPQRGGGRGCPGPGSDHGSAWWWRWSQQLQEHREQRRRQQNRPCGGRGGARRLVNVPESGAGRRQVGAEQQQRQQSAPDELGLQRCLGGAAGAAERRRHAGDSVRITAVDQGIHQEDRGELGAHGDGGVRAAGARRRGAEAAGEDQPAVHRALRRHPHQAQEDGQGDDPLRRGDLHRGAARESQGPRGAGCCRRQGHRDGGSNGATVAGKELSTGERGAVLAEQQRDGEDPLRERRGGDPEDSLRGRGDPPQNHQRQCHAISGRHHHDNNNRCKGIKTKFVLELFSPNINYLI